MKLSSYLLLAFGYTGFASAMSIGQSSDGLTAIEKRGCFNTGAKWGDQRDAALNAAKTACNGPLKGTYYHREVRVKCYNIGGNKHAKFSVGLTGKNAGSSRNIGYDECVSGVQGRITSCDKGDEHTYGNWYYRADPNEGPC